MTAETTTAALRTPSEPMAFSPGELFRATRNIWVLFMALLVIGEIVILVAIQLTSDSIVISSSPPLVLSLMFTVGFMAVVAGIISGIASIFGILVARLIGLALRRVAALGVHVAVYALFGSLVGILYVALFTGGKMLLPLDVWGMITAFPGVCAALAIPLGWWWTVRRILREDVHPRRGRGVVDVDSAAEDTIIDSAPTTAVDRPGTAPS